LTDIFTGAEAIVQYAI